MVVLQVVKSLLEDRNEDLSTHDCAVYSDLTNTLTPRPCDAKHEWICKVSRGGSQFVHTYMGVCVRVYMRVTHSISSEFVLSYTAMYT